MSATYTCESCGGVFEHGWTAEEAAAEAAATFTPEELTDTAVVCEDCWQAMRQSVAGLDERYRSSSSTETGTTTGEQT